MNAKGKLSIALLKVYARHTDRLTGSHDKGLQERQTALEKFNFVRLDAAGGKVAFRSTYRCKARQGSDEPRSIAKLCMSTIRAQLVSQPLLVAIYI